VTVVQYEQPPPLPPSRPGDELVVGPTGDVARLRAAAEYAGYIADTEFVPEALRNRPAAIAAAMLAGAEVGLKPMASLRMVSMIQGRPTLTAEAQRGLVAGAGHELWFEESTTTRAIAAGRRAGSDRIGRVTWTLDDAKRAGIAGKSNWRAYPAEMLRARASAALARAMFADVTLGIPASEELEDEPDGRPPESPAPPPDDAPTPPAPSRARRRRTPEPKPEPEAKPALPPTPPPDDQPAPEIPPDPPATGAMQRQIFALMRDVGMPADDRDGRLAYTVRVIGRTIGSSTDLTIGEAGQVIDDLQRIKQLPAAERPAALQGDVEARVGDGEPGDPDGEPGDDDGAEGHERPPPDLYNEFPPGY
jgi:hypothetical protein